MEKFDSITHFLQSGEFDYRIFDMGRKVTPLSNAEFQKFEGQKQVYPFPFQQKAWLALLFWPTAQNTQGKKESVIWFLQFPIDELGFLKQESRDGFLIGLLEQAGKNIQAKQQGNESLDELNESPFAFKPQADRLAMFHALATVVLGQPASQYYQHTRDYLSGKTGYEQWQFLGLQGIADVVARISEDNNEALLTDAISQLPPVPLESFSQALEHIQPKGELAKALVLRLDQALEKSAPDVKIVSALLRALSASQPKKQRKSVLLKVLNSSISEEIEVIVVISGRAWKDLADSKILIRFIEKLSMQSQEAFNAIVADLIMLPKMRPMVLEVMRSPNRPESLTYKLNIFMRLIQGN